MQNDEKVSTPSYQFELIKALFPEKRSHQDVGVRHQMFSVLTGALHGDWKLQNATEIIERWGVSGWETGVNAAFDTLEDLSAAVFVGHVYCGGHFTSQFALPVHKCFNRDIVAAATGRLVCGAYRGFAQCMGYILTRDEGTRKVMQIELALTPYCIGASCETTHGPVGAISNYIAEIILKERDAGVKVPTSSVVIGEFWKLTPNLTSSKLANVIARSWTIKAFASIDTTDCLGIMKRYFEPL